MAKQSIPATVKHANCTMKLVVNSSGPHYAKLVCSDHKDAFVQWVNKEQADIIQREMRIDQFMIQFPDTDRNELSEWINDHPTITDQEIINDINEGLFENTEFYNDLYEIWKSNNNGQGLTYQQTLHVFKFYDTLLEYGETDNNGVINDLYS